MWKKSWFWHHILYFWKPEPEPGYPGFLESKPETRFFKTRPGFENTTVNWALVYLLSNKLGWCFAQKKTILKDRPMFQEKPFKILLKLTFKNWRNFVNIEIIRNPSSNNLNMLCSFLLSSLSKMTFS